MPPLVPGTGRVVQWIDARDLCPWMIRLAETGTAGVFNGVGPASYYTNEALMHGLAAASRDAYQRLTDEKTQSGVREGFQAEPRAT